MDIKKYFKKNTQDDIEDSGEKPNQVDVMYVKVSYVAQKLPINLYYKIEAGAEDKATYIPDISLENIETNKVYRASAIDIPLTISKSNRAKGEKEKDYLKKKSGGQPLYLKGVFSEDVYLTKKDQSGMTEEEVGDEDIRVSPLVMLADKYIKENFGSPKIKDAKGKEAKPSIEHSLRKKQIMAVLFRSQENPSAVLWLKDKIGNYAERSFTFMNISDIDSEEAFKEQAMISISRQLGAISGSDSVSLQDDEVDLIPIPEVELLKYASPSFKKDSYPVESEIFSLPKNYVAITTSILGAGIAFAGFSFDTYSNIQLSNIKKEESNVMAQMPDVQGIREGIMQDHVMYYLNDKSIDFKEGFKVAENVWITGTKAQITQNESVTRVDLAMNDDQEDPYVLYSIAKKMEEQDAPEGFTKEAVTSNGGFSTYRVSYVK